MKIDITDRVYELMEEMQRIIQEELKAQGHNLTGNLSRNMTIEVKESEYKINGYLYLEDYYVHIEYPLRPGQIPYTRGSGATASKMIEGLIRFFRIKGVGDPVRASFATANKWLQEGRPTKNSYSFSSNGRRTGFMKQSVLTFERQAFIRLENIWVEAGNKYFRAYFRSLSEAKVA